MRTYGTKIDYGRACGVIAVFLLMLVPAAGYGASEALRLEPPPAADAVVGAALRLELHISAADFEELSIEATLITPLLEVKQLEFAGEGLSTGNGTACAVFTPRVPGEYDLSVILRGYTEGASRSIRRSLNFAVGRGEALYIEGAVEAGRVYPGSAASFSATVKTRRVRGRKVEIHPGALAMDDEHHLEADLIEYAPRGIAPEELPAVVDFHIPVPQETPPGLYEGVMEIRSETDRVAVPVVLSVLDPEIILSEPVLDLGSIRQGSDGRVELMIGLTGGVQDFEVTLQPWISRTGRHGPGMFVEGLGRQFTLRSGGEETICVSAYALESTAPGRYHSTLVIETPQRRVEIPVQARVTRIPMSMQQVFVYALIVLIAVLALVAMLDMARAFRGRALTPLQRFLLASAMLHLLLLLLSAFLFFEQAGETEPQRVAVRAVRIAGESGIPGARASEKDSFLSESEEIDHAEREVELERAQHDFAKERMAGRIAEEPAEEFRGMPREPERVSEAELVEEEVEQARRRAAEEVSVVDTGAVAVREAEAEAAPESARAIEVARADVAADERPDRVAEPARMEEEGEARRPGPELSRAESVEVVEEPVEASRRRAAEEVSVVDAGTVAVREAEAEAAPESARAIEVARADVAADERPDRGAEPARMEEEGEVRRVRTGLSRTVAGPEMQAVSAGAGSPGLGDQLSAGRLVIGHGIYEGDWDCELSAIPNLAYQIERRVGLAIEADTRFVRLDSQDIFDTAFIFMTGHLDFRFSDGEIGQLRRYMHAGGALWINDSTHEGDNTFDRAVQRELKRLFPESELETIPMDSPLFTACYDLSGGYLGYDIPPGDKYRENRLRGIRIGGRWALVYTRNDYGDGLEIDPNTHPLMESLTDLSPHEMQEGSIRMGMNLAFYFLGSEGLDKTQRATLDRMRHEASAVPEVESMKRAMLEGRASLPFGDMAGEGAAWRVAEDWSGDPARLDIRPGGGLMVKLTTGEEGKNVVGKEISADLSGYSRLRMRVRSDMEAGARLAIGLSTGEEWSYFESAPQYIRPGSNPYVIFELKANDFKTEATGWEYAAPASNLDDVRSIHLLFYPIYGGFVMVEGMELVW